MNIEGANPVDSLARRVIQPSRDDRPEQAYDDRLLVQPETKPLPQPFGSVCTDLSGRVVDDLTVIGYHRSISKTESKNGSTLWVCRCVCGYFVLRTRRYLRKPKKHRKACGECMNTRRIMAK